MKEMELKGFEELCENEERSVQGGECYFGPYYMICRNRNGTYSRYWYGCW